MRKPAHDQADKVTLRDFETLMLAVPEAGKKYSPV
jgi:hypothetical protein